MKPAPEQEARMKLWLKDRLCALYAGNPFTVQPAAIAEDLRNGVDFSTTFAEYGFGTDGLQLLPDFFQIQVERGFKTA
jgi:hypothetical protein